MKKFVVAVCNVEDDCTIKMKIEYNCFSKLDALCQNFDLDPALLAKNFTVEDLIEDWAGQGLLVGVLEID